MNYKIAHECGRKAVISNSLKGSSSQNFVLAEILNEVLKTIELSDTLPIVVGKVKDAFEAVGIQFFANKFTLDACQQKMTDNLWRWISYENTTGKGKIVGRNLSVYVKINGEKTLVQANLLIERSKSYHLVKFRNGKPSLTYGKGIDAASRSIELYILEKAGRLLKRKMGLDKPVAPAYYFLRARSDKKAVRNSVFEQERGENIISYLHSDIEKQDILSVIKATTADISNFSTKCFGCSYSDLCNAEFTPRKKKPVIKKTSNRFSFINLSKEQKSLIYSDAPIIQVNAVAGSGKTTVIGLRTLSQLEELEDEGYESKDPAILMITFTDKASKEMREKLEGYNGVFYGGCLDTSKVEIETFNSWGHKLIKKYYKQLGFTAEPEVVDDMLKREIVINLLETSPKLPLDYENPFMDMKYAKGAVIEMVGLMDKLKAHNIKSGDDTLKVMKEWRSTENMWYNTQDIVYNFYAAYNAELKKNNVIDYEDQLRMLTDLRSLGVFKALTYHHIVVDEYQDSNPNQIAIIKAIKEDSPAVRSIAVVGDVMQAIYSFRNTSPENLLNFGRDFRGSKSFDLTTNFRSSEGVINWANRMLTRDPDAKGAKLLIPSREKINEPVLFAYDKIEERTMPILQQIDKWKNAGISFEDMAIVSRNKSELLDLQTILNKSGIPSTIRVPEIVRDNSYVKAMFSLNLFIKNQDENGLALYAKSKGMDPFDFNEVHKLGEEISSKFESLTPAEQLNDYMLMLEEISENDFVAKDFFEKVKRQHAHSLAEVVNFIYKYDMYQVKDSIVADVEDGGITLITTHSSKGLEYNNVILLIEKFKDTAEEKRLLYVGVTRARNELMIVANKSQRSLLSLLAVSEQNLIKNAI